MITKPLVALNHVSKSYPVRNILGLKRGAVHALDGVEFSIAAGETLGIVGESGSGKSTIARVILGLTSPSSGQMMVDGKDLASLSNSQLRAMRKSLQIIFQNPFGSLHPRMTIGALLGEPLRLHKGLRGGELDAAVESLLEDVGLSPQSASRYAHQFSGGQRQRIGIARALASGAELIVCDEPVSALDVSVQAQIINLLKKLQEERNVSYLFIAHDLAVVRHICHRVAVMYLGRVVEIGDVDKVFKTPRHPYTRSLLDAIPHADPINVFTRQLVRGEPPSPMDRPSGCSFRKRCPHAIQICAEVAPQLTSSKDGAHQSACHRVDVIPPYPAPAEPPVSNTVLRLMTAFRTA